MKKIGLSIFLMSMLLVQPLAFALTPAAGVVVIPDAIKNARLEEIVSFVKPVLPQQGFSQEKLEASDKLYKLGFEHAGQKLRVALLEKKRLSDISEKGYQSFDESVIKAYLDRKVLSYDLANQSRMPKNYKRCGNPNCAKAECRILQGELEESNSGNYIIMSSNETVYWSYNFENEMNEITHNGRRYRLIPQEELPREVQRIRSRGTVDARNWITNAIAAFEWVETPIEQYSKVPPQDVLNKLEKAKEGNTFDYYTVATVENIADPLLLGRINGDSTRFFIAQWDKDISIEEVLAAKK